MFLRGSGARKVVVQEIQVGCEAQAMLIVRRARARVRFSSVLGDLQKARASGLDSMNAPGSNNLERAVFPIEHHGQHYRRRSVRK